MEVVPHYRPEVPLGDDGFVTNVEEWSEMNGTQHIRREFGRWLKPGGGQEYRQASDWCRTELDDGERTQRRSCEVFSSDDPGKKMQVLRAQQQWSEVRGTPGTASSRTVHVSRQVQATASSSSTSRSASSTKVTRTTTSSLTSSPIMEHLGHFSEDTFGSLQLALNQLDHSTQKLKGSVGRMGAISSRRPPSRLHRISSGALLDIPQEEPTQNSVPKVPSPPPPPPPPPSNIEAPVRGKSRSTDDLPFEEPAWRRDVKLRRSLRLSAESRFVPDRSEQLPVEVERRPSRVSAFNVRETIEQRRRSLQSSMQQRHSPVSEDASDKEVTKKKSDEWWERRKSYGFESAESWRRNDSESDSRRHSTGSDTSGKTVITLGNPEKSYSASDLVQQVEAEKVTGMWSRESKERRSLRESKWKETDMREFKWKETDMRESKWKETDMRDVERTFFRCAMMKSPEVQQRKPLVITIPIRIEETNGGQTSPGAQEKKESRSPQIYNSKTWITNGATKVATAVIQPEQPDEESAQQKQKKKVEFSKMEVHFSAESGRFNIVETSDEKPPSNLFRRRRKEKYASDKKDDLKDVQETRFGDSPYEKWLLGKPEDGSEDTTENNITNNSEENCKNEDVIHHTWGVQLRRVNSNASRPQPEKCRPESEEPYWKTSVKLKPLDNGLTCGTGTSSVHKDEMRLQQLVRSLRPTGSPLLQVVQRDTTLCEEQERNSVQDHSHVKKDEFETHNSKKYQHHWDAYNIEENEDNSCQTPSPVRKPFRIDAGIIFDSDVKERQTSSVCVNSSSVGVNSSSMGVNSSSMCVNSSSNHSRALSIPITILPYNSEHTNNSPSPRSHPRSDQHTRQKLSPRLRQVSPLPQHRSNATSALELPPNSHSVESRVENSSWKNPDIKSGALWDKRYTHESVSQTTQKTVHVDVTTRSLDKQDVVPSWERNGELRSSFQRKHISPKENGDDQHGGSGHRSIVERLKDRLREQCSPLHRDQTATSSSGSKTDWIYFETPKRKQKAANVAEKKTEDYHVEVKTEAGSSPSTKDKKSESRHTKTDNKKVEVRHTSKKQEGGRHTTTTTLPKELPNPLTESFPVPNRKAKLSLNNIMSVQNHKSDTDDELTRAANTILEAVAGYTDCSSQPQSEEETVSKTRTQNHHRNYRRAANKSSSESMTSDHLEVPVAKKHTHRKHRMKGITEEETGKTVFEHKPIVKKISPAKVARHTAHTHSSAQKAKPCLRHKDSSSSEMSTPSGSLSKTTGRKKLAAAVSRMNGHHLDKVEEGVTPKERTSSKAPVAVKETGHYVAQVNTKKRTNNHKVTSNRPQKNKVKTATTKDETDKSTKSRQKIKTTKELTAYI